MNTNEAANIHDLAHASVVTHALVFASNAAAFMLGGEELLRTKEIKPDILDQCLRNTYEKMYERYVSHNSYNSPLEVNSFKWGNKVAVTLDGNTIHNSEAHYVEAFQDLIKLHNKMPKFSLENRNNNFPSGTTTAGEQYINLFWEGSYGGALGIQFDEYFIYVSGRKCATVYGDIMIFGNDLFRYGTQSTQGNTITLGDPTFDKGYAIRVCKRGSLL